MNAPTANIGVVANVFVRQMHFKHEGDTELGHRHSYDHLTLLAKGKLRVSVNGKSTEYTAPTMIYIRAEFNHELTALTPDTVAYCVHGLRGSDVSEDLVDPAAVPSGSELRKILKTITIKGSSHANANRPE